MIKEVNKRINKENQQKSRYPNNQIIDYNCVFKFSLSLIGTSNISIASSADLLSLVMMFLISFKVASARHSSRITSITPSSSYSKILTSITSSLCFMKKSDSTSSLIHSSTASITARIHCHCIFWQQQMSYHHSQFYAGYRYYRQIS